MTLQCLLACRQKVFANMHTSESAYTIVSTNISENLYIQQHINTYTYTNIYRYINIFLDTYIYMYTYTNMYRYINIFIDTYTYIHIHMYVCIIVYL